VASVDGAQRHVDRVGRLLLARRRSTRHTGRGALLVGRAVAGTAAGSESPGHRLGHRRWRERATPPPPRLGLGPRHSRSLCYGTHSVLFQAGRWRSTEVGRTSAGRAGHGTRCRRGPTGWSPDDSGVVCHLICCIATTDISRTTSSPPQAGSGLNFTAFATTSTTIGAEKPSRCGQATSEFPSQRLSETSWGIVSELRVVSSSTTSPGIEFPSEQVPLTVEPGSHASALDVVDRCWVIPTVGGRALSCESRLLLRVLAAYRAGGWSAG
jgi:hypothetical protein